jgi:hypothetical protein
MKIWYFDNSLNLHTIKKIQILFEGASLYFYDLRALLFRKNLMKTEVYKNRIAHAKMISPNYFSRN